MARGEMRYCGWRALGMRRLVFSYPRSQHLRGFAGVAVVNPSKCTALLDAGKGLLAQGLSVVWGTCVAASSIK